MLNDVTVTCMIVSGIGAAVFLIIFRVIISKIQNSSISAGNLVNGDLITSVEELHDYDPSVSVPEGSFGSAAIWAYRWKGETRLYSESVDDGAPCKTRVLPLDKNGCVRSNQNDSVAPYLIAEFIIVIFIAILNAIILNQ